MYRDRQYRLYFDCVMYCYNNDSLQESAGRNWNESPLGLTKRGISASSAERSLLLGVIASHLGTLDTRDNDSRTVQRKSLIWDHVSKEFNSRCYVPRSKNQIQTLFKNMKAKARKYQARLHDAEKQVENVLPPEPDPISALLLQLLAGEHAHRLLHLEQTAMNTAGEMSSYSDSRVRVSPLIPFDSYSSEGDDGNKTYKEENQPHSNQIIELSSDDSPAQCVKEELPDFSPLLSTSQGSSPTTANGNVSPASDREKLLDDETALKEPTDVKRPNHNFQSQSEAPQNLPNSATSLLYGTDMEAIFNDPTNSFNLNQPSSLQTEFGGSKHCCPYIHKQMVAFMKEEHDLRLEILKRERRYKDEEHIQKMKILRLEKEIFFSKVMSQSLVLRDPRFGNSNVGSLEESVANGHFETGSKTLDPQIKANDEKAKNSCGNQSIPNSDRRVGHSKNINFTTETSFENLV